MTRSNIDLAHIDLEPPAAKARSVSRTNCHRALAGAIVALALCAGSTGAVAQFYDFMPDRFFGEPERKMPARIVVNRLQNRGFSEIARPRFDGEAYVIEATNPGGARVRLYVDAYDGSMLGRQRLGPVLPLRDRFARTEPGRGRAGDDGLMPPGEIPSVPGRNAQRDATIGAALRRGGDEMAPAGAAPDSAARPAKKSARLNPPQRPAAPEASPAAPAPKMQPAEARKAPPDAAKEEATKTDPQKVNPAIPDAAKADAKPDNAGAEAATDAKRDAQAPETAKSETTPSEAASGEPKKDPAGASGSTPAAGPAAPVTPAWNEPPKEASATDKPADQAVRETEGPRKNVRVIDGATIVPGTETPAAN